MFGTQAWFTFVGELLRNDVQQLLGKNLWRAGAVVSLMVAGAVLLLIGGVYAMVGDRTGYYLMLVGVVFWGLSAALFFVFALMEPSLHGGKDR